MISPLVCIDILFHVLHFKHLILLRQYDKKVMKMSIWPLQERFQISNLCFPEFNYKKYSKLISTLWSFFIALHSFIIFMSLIRVSERFKFNTSNSLSMPQLLKGLRLTILLFLSFSIILLQTNNHLFQGLHFLPLSHLGYIIDLSSSNYIVNLL